ncbi:MAG: transcriptional regulator [Sphaerochaeta sp.]
MASTQEYIAFVCNQIDDSWNPRSRKMFGDYMVYVHEKPVLLVCDNTVYVKKLPCIEHLMVNADSQEPFNGAKAWYILDIEDRALVEQVLQKAASVTALPKRKKRRTTCE